MKRVHLSKVPESAVGHRPEYLNAKGLLQVYGIPRALAYQLTKQGLIKSVSIRRPGTKRGKRIWEAASVRRFVAACQREQEATSNV